ncbi:MAG: helix-turn-helix transcriptional regulator [Pseudodesulfovibrio sp.]|uniref:Helix-turn-helix HxlR type n=1 Tax=Pseudodesulfovibrio aespoeensis (strain ATCC 700646 / DSM 10631 / Aspo-2) TaxID=643562 RepID=E6VY83_PSEA9|nr:MULTISPECIES: helix-turn-helix domain-containing protein [Pseudodesulfovibrio]MBU4192200.1 helix-turn-helix transcriptional regulator [Pseudomonadota bacterium]ADU61541.1 helix-turn-helix HxlR type [Pseudodesulfovibrio aespoeensis Aspo-2]MBU4242986.1 helix-turn-helix transcriptional regulator [Pseudomonadota bacterium]MBU4378194.1 helix-turn-helix transcriptional regulator [Pseudomonadota bacterium]MBU4474529.1 helix-turn-helix transcriptional regulator [Pseudomonadota bacterium]
MSGNCTLRHCGNKTYYCNVELTLQVIGGKWKPIIMYRLGDGGTLRFSEIKRSIPNITQKMLTQQLRELEADGVVRREVHAQVPPRVDYSLTELGLSVMPVIESLCRWGARYEEWAVSRESGVARSA